MTEPDPVVTAVQALLEPLPAIPGFFEEYARAVADPMVRCVLMGRFLAETADALRAGGMTPATRKLCEKQVDRMWKAYGVHPEHWGQIARRLATSFDQTAKIREGRGADAAKSLFARLLMSAYAPAVARLDASALEAVDVCAAVWRRRAGAPSASDTRPSKWVAFARVVEALGLGQIEPDDLKKECSRGRVKNRRKPRP